MSLIDEIETLGASLSSLAWIRASMGLGVRDMVCGFIWIGPLTLI
jgi:hypothetical protein